MSLTRVVAVVRSGAQQRAQAANKVVLYCPLEGGRIAAGDWPGLHEEQGSRWPFVLTEGRSGAVADYGSGYDPRTYTTNLPDKVLQVGEFFTLGGMGASSAYQVTVCHAFEPHGVVRLAKVVATCVDAHRKPQNRLVFIGPVDRQHQLVEGLWLGYSAEGSEFEPFSFDPAKLYLDYGSEWVDWREKTDFKSAAPGTGFSVQSWDDAGKPDEWRYSVASCDFL